MWTPSEEGELDTGKIAELRASLSKDGWQGPPLVKWGYFHLITGSHRYTAAKSLGWEDSEIPMVNLEDVFAEAGLDFDALYQQCDCPTWSDIWFSGLLDELPREIVNRYGIQW